MNYIALYIILMFTGEYDVGTIGIRYFDTKVECQEWVMSDENRQTMINNYKGKNVQQVIPICIHNIRSIDLMVKTAITGI